MLSAGFSGDALREDLLKQIQTGRLRPGTRISSFRALAGQYNISLNTVQRVIGDLVDAKVLEAAHGRGTFVATAKELCAKTDAAVGIFARATGHFYGDMIDTLRNAFVQQGISPVIFDAHQERLELVCATRLKELIQGNPLTLIVDGSLGSSPVTGKPYLHQALMRYADQIKDLIVINRWDHPERPIGSYLLFDYFDAGVQIARYLYGMGHRRIVINTYGLPPLAGTSEDDIVRGIHSYLDQYKGLIQIENFQVPMARAPFDEDRFLKLFTSGDRPTAIVTMADYLAEEWFTRLAPLNIKVPNDVSIVGFYNTPWVEKLPVRLTSMQMNIEKLVLHTINHVMRNRNNDGEVEHENLSVGASLVVRGSSGPAM
jgi:GntR family transcriptional regulator, arabinose operon transcriptional repressor